MKFVMMFVGCLGLVSCGSFEGSAYGAPAPMPSTVYSSDEASSTDVIRAERKLIRNGSMTLECLDVKAAAKGAEGVVKRHGGFVENKTEGEEVSLEVRVPEDKLVVSMDALAKLGTVTYRKVRVKDVTDEYIDVEAKIKNMRLLRERLRALYAKSGKVEEMLKIEKELARLQGDLDSLEGRMQAMKRDIAYSELSISIERKRVPGPLGVVGKGIGWVGKKLWVLN